MLRSLPRWPVLLMLLWFPPLPALVQEWRAMRDEYGGEFENARRMDALDRAGLDGYVEHERWRSNQRALAEYNGRLPAAPAAPAMPPPPASPRPR